MTQAFPHIANFLDTSVWSKGHGALLNFSMYYTRSSVQLAKVSFLACKLDTTSVSLHCNHVLHVYVTKKHLNQKNSFASASQDAYLECEIMIYKKDDTATYETEGI